MNNKIDAVLFDLDDTLIDTKNLESYRKNPNKTPLTDEQLNQTNIFSNVENILKKLHKDSIKLGVVTNSRRFSS